MVLLLAQIIGFAGVGLFFLSYQLKKRAHIIWVTFISNTFYVLQYLLLGAFSGATMDVLSSIASFVAVKKESPKIKKHATLYAIASVLVITAVGLVIAALRKDLIELLPIAGTVFFVISLWCDDEQNIRRFGLLSAPFWLVYNFISRAYGAAFGSLLAIISILTSLYRYRKNK